MKRNTAVRMTKLRLLWWLQPITETVRNTQGLPPQATVLSAVGHRRMWAVWPVSRKILPGVPRPQKGGFDSLKTDVIGWLCVSSGKIDLTARGQSRPQCFVLCWIHPGCLVSQPGLSGKPRQRDHSRAALVVHLLTSIWKFSVGLEE